MKIYTNVAAVPSRVLALLELLAERGETPTTDLHDLLHPPPLRGGEQFQEIVDAARECGLITSSRAVLKLTKQASASLLGAGKRISDELPVLMGTITTRPEIDGSTNRFARICAWLLSYSLDKMPQDHQQFKERFAGDGLDRQAYYLNDNAVWDMVFYWMRYIGLISRLSSDGVSGVIPDPTRFLASRIEFIFAKAGDNALTAHAFRSAVAQICPVLDGGAVWTAVNDTIGRQVPADHLSPTLTFSLRRLEAARVLKSIAVRDARQFLLRSDGEQFTHVEKV